MLDAFKNMTGGKGKLVQKQTDELELLIATAREERSAISAMLTALTTRSAKLTPLGKTLEQVVGEGDRRHDAPRRDRQAPDRARRSHQGARGGRQAHPGAEGRRPAGRADDAEGARPGRRAAEASRGRAAPVVAGARHAGDARHAEEGARDARGAARPAAQGRGRSEAVARPVRARSRPSSIRSARVAADAHAGLREDPRDVARSARRHDRGDDDGQGSREQARAARAAPRAEPEHRRAPHRAQRARRARLAQGQGARQPAAVGRARRRAGQPRQRDGLGDGRADRQAERGHEAGRRAPTTRSAASRSWPHETTAQLETAAQAAARRPSARRAS